MQRQRQAIFETGLAAIHIQTLDRLDESRSTKQSFEPRSSADACSTSRRGMAVIVSDVTFESPPLFAIDSRRKFKIERWVINPS